MVKKFFNEWGDAILDCLNDHRQYVTGQLKTICENFWADHDKKLFKLDDIKDILMRKKVATRPYMCGGGTSYCLWCPDKMRFGEKKSVILANINNIWGI